MGSNPVGSTMIDLDKAKKHLESYKYILDSGCWILSCVVRDDGKGYKKIWIQKKDIRLIRLSAAIYKGLDLTKSYILVCHIPSCYNKACWNPDHLYLGDNKTNTEDKIKTRDGKCVNGHDYYSNVSIDSRGYRFCKQCNREAQVRRRLNKKS